MTAPQPRYQTDPRVDDYIDALPDWQRAICRRLRGVIHAAEAELVETIKRTVRPYFVLEGNACALLATKDHVNLFLYDGGIVPDPEGIITAGHEFERPTWFEPSCISSSPSSCLARSPRPASVPSL